MFDTKLAVILCFLIMFAGGLAAFAQITKWTVIKACTWSFKRKEHRFKPAVIFAVSAAALCIIYGAVFAAGFYPGITSPDSVAQIEQTFTGVYSNHHPFWHTMIIQACLRLGTGLFGDINTGVCIYSVLQIMVMGCSFGYVIMTLYQMKLSYGLIIPCFLYFAVMPYHIFYSFTMWKDVMFGSAMAVFITALFRIMAGIPYHLTHKAKGKVRCGAANMIILTVSAFGTCLLRSNGQIAFAVAFIAAIFVLGIRYWKVLLVLLAVLIATIALKYPFLSAVNVTQPDTIESLSIPAQQIARIVADGGELTDEQKELLSHIVDVDRVADTYTWYTSDPIKDLVREKNDQAYISEHRAEFVRLYLEMALQHPAGFAKGWIDATKGYFNGGYGYWNWTIVNENSYGIVRAPMSEDAERVLGSYPDLFNSIYVLQPFVSIGLCTWAVIILFTACICARKKQALLAVPCIAMTLTLLIATPIYAEFRYAYALFTCIPMLTAASMFTINSFNKQKRV